MATREKWIFSSLKKDVDAIVLMNAVEPNLDGSFFYATGIPSGLFEGCLAVVKPSGVEVLTSELEALSAEEAGVKTNVFENGDGRAKLMKRKLSRFGRIGINSKELTLANFKTIKKAAGKAKLIDVSDDLYQARMIKQPDEIARISKACRIVSEVCRSTPEFVAGGMLETEAAAELNYRMMKLGATGPAFTTTVAFGPKSAEPHYTPSRRKLRKGDFALFDFGALYERYVSDLTRTFVCGKATRRQKEMHEVVLKAQEEALDMITDGVHGEDVDSAARTLVDESKFKDLFIHSTGHGLGISVHDPGSISSARDMVLREGMVLTVEPGVYIKGFGGVRIEDDVLVKKNGCKVLTSCPKDLRTL
ncbi:TPA: aminopeptidase P family protein [Thermoplasmata archaeon]|nr:aminopeptidase P family protein [Thermoplasmata archaeon]